MKVLFGTVIRAAPIPQGGELVSLDWRQRRVTKRVAIVPSNPPIEHDPNPRGNTRGCRGIALLDGHIIAADYHTLRVFDTNLNHLRDLSHGLMVGLHELYAGSDGGIWATSTAIDTALQFDLTTGNLRSSFWPREMRSFQEAFGLEPLEIRKDSDNRLLFLEGRHVVHPSHIHLNAVAEWNGDVFALFARKGAVANLTEGKIVIENAGMRGAHNLVILDDGTTLINDSRCATIRIYDIRSGRLVDSVDLREFGWVKWLQLKSSLQGHLRRTRKLGRGLFLRGMDVIDDLAYVGLSPASILCVDWRRKKLIDTFQYSNDVLAAVHGLKVLSA